MIEAALAVLTAAVIGLVIAVVDLASRVRTQERRSVVLRQENPSWTVKYSKPEGV